MGLRLISSDDFEVASVENILGRAEDLLAGAAPMLGRRHSALLFLETSLRTRTGFLAAAHRLGWPTPIEVFDRRASEIAMPESLADTVAVLAAYVEVLIVRLDRPIGPLLPFVNQTTSLINGGDRGPTAEHPTQALIDLFAMQHLLGDLSSLRIALCGDLRMRSARSMLKLLAQHRPAELVLVTDSSLMQGLELPDGLGPHRLVDSVEQVRDIDALHALGIPHLATTEDVRSRLRVNATTLRHLSTRGRVFSPMPVIDEIAQSVRSHESMAFLEQSALALAVRMAIIESL